MGGSVVLWCIQLRCSICRAHLFQLTLRATTSVPLYGDTRGSVKGLVWTGDWALTCTPVERETGLGWARATKQEEMSHSGFWKPGSEL